MCSVDQLGRPSELVAELLYGGIVAMNVSRSEVALTSLGVVEFVYPDGSTFQFESTASTADEFVQVVRPRLVPR